MLVRSKTIYFFRNSYTSSSCEFNQVKATFLGAVSYKLDIQFETPLIELAAYNSVFMKLWLER